MTTSSWCPLHRCVGHVTKLRITGDGSELEEPQASAARSETPWHSQVEEPGVGCTCAVYLRVGSAAPRARTVRSPQPEELLSPHFSHCLRTQTTSHRLKLCWAVSPYFPNYLVLCESLKEKKNKSVIKNYLGTQVNEM